MAILEDLEDLKHFFDDPEEDEDDSYDPYENIGATEVLMQSRGVPKNKDHLLSILPEKAVIDRLMNRYFNSNSPSQHIIHVPTFLREYNDFCKDPHSASLHWIALLYMILALGVFFSLFSAPHELESDSPMSGMDRFKQYRGAAGWALIWGKYSQPGPYTIQAFLLYAEGDFMSNRENRTNCYLLLSVVIRLMLKAGFHRDPSKLPNISPYDGEMRRRMWGLAIQLDLLVGFNLGLPCMIHGVESDTDFPTHLIDTDFDQDTKELPPARPMSDYTPLTYPINKAKITRIFSKVVRQAHAITAPAYADVMRIDAELEEAWRGVPVFMKMKPMEESVMDPPIKVIQRFGLASMYQKSRCILHRRYIVEVVPRAEHDYSRRACLDAALAMLEYQSIMHDACKPNGILSQGGWFVSALVAVNDFLLADLVVAQVLQDDKCWDEGGWTARSMPTLGRDKLLQVLRRSNYIWYDMATTVSEFKKAGDIVGTMLRRVEAQSGVFENGDSEISGAGTTSGSGGEISSVGNLSLSGSGLSTASSDIADISADMISRTTGPSPMMTVGGTAGHIGVESPWAIPNAYDWNYLDPMARDPDPIQPTAQMVHEAWLDGKAINDFSGFAAPNAWNFGPF